MRKAGGNWVDGDRFFNRETEVEALIERVRDGRHTLLTAQRRMGKTSLVRETLRRLGERGEVEPLFVDLEDAMAPEDAIAEFAARTLAAQGRWFPIKRAFANFLEQDRGRGQPWRERYFRGTGETNLTPVPDVLLLLEHDGYLARISAGYGFVSRLVEDRWRARFGLNLVPIGRRRNDAEG